MEISLSYFMKTSKEGIIQNLFLNFCSWKDINDFMNFSNILYFIIKEHEEAKSEYVDIANLIGIKGMIPINQEFFKKKQTQNLESEIYISIAKLPIENKQKKSISNEVIFNNYKESMLFDLKSSFIIKMATIMFVRSLILTCISQENLSFIFQKLNFDYLLKSQTDSENSNIQLAIQATDLISKINNKSLLVNDLERLIFHMNHISVGGISVLNKLNLKATLHLKEIIETIRKNFQEEKLMLKNEELMKEYSRVSGDFCYLLSSIFNQNLSTINPEWISQQKEISYYLEGKSNELNNTLFDLKIQSAILAAYRFTTKLSNPNISSIILDKNQIYIIIKEYKLLRIIFQNINSIVNLDDNICTETSHSSYKRMFFRNSKILLGSRTTT